MIYLHIGRHKTGTSQLQHFMSRNRDKLKDINYVYPKLGAHAVAHHRVALHLMDAATENNPSSAQGALDVAELQRQFDSSDNAFVVSSEAFQNIQPHRALELVGERETTVVCYLREQAKYALSAYSQHVVGEKYCEGFNRFAETFCSAVNYNDNISKWVQLFGANSVRLRVYDVDMLINQDIRCDFLDVLGIDSSANDFDFNYFANTAAIFGDLLKMKIALNSMDYNEPKYRPHVVTVLREIALDCPEYSAEPHMSPKLVAKIRDYYREPNGLLFDEYQIENASGFSNLNLSGYSGGPYIDESFDWRHISSAESILAEMYLRNKDVAKLFERALKVSDVQMH